MAVLDLLHVLADGGCHSDQGLAERQEVSRTAISKQVASLAGMGIEVERVRGQGYCIPGGLDLLNAGAICSALNKGAEAELAELLVFSTIDSTNAELQRRGAPVSGTTVCVAEQQTAGRGRRGKQWVSPFAGSIYLSLTRDFRGGAETFEGLSLAIGVVVCQVLEAQGVQGLALKWPNDVLLGGRKLAGVLVEVTGDVSGPCTAVVGIGINVALPVPAQEEIDQPWTDLRTSQGEAPVRNVLMASLLNTLLPLLRDYDQQGFAAWRKAWLALDAYSDQAVLIHQGSQRLAGTARGVDERGALRLETATGIQVLHGGEVSLRPAQS